MIWSETKTKIACWLAVGCLQTGYKVENIAMTNTSGMTCYCGYDAKAERLVGGLTRYP